jgi:hypothetical protein
MELSQYTFEFNGVAINAGTYGDDYIPELCRVLDTHVRKEARAVLEWGSGLTTQVFADYGASRWDTRLMVSLDENAAYQKAIFGSQEIPRFLKLDVVGQIGPARSQDDVGINFSTYPLRFLCKFDVIFIDARRRMECAFMAAIMFHPDTVIILHDYRRSRYQPILALFQIVEDGSQFRVMRPRPDVLAAMAPGIEGVESYMRCLQHRKINLD